MARLLYKLAAFTGHKGVEQLLVVHEVRDPRRVFIGFKSCFRKAALNCIIYFFDRERFGGGDVYIEYV